MEITCKTARIRVFYVENDSPIGFLTEVDGKLMASRKPTYSIIIRNIYQHLNCMNQPSDESLVGAPKLSKPPPSTSTNVAMYISQEHYIFISVPAQFSKCLVRASPWQNITQKFSD